MVIEMAKHLDRRARRGLTAQARHSDDVLSGQRPHLLNRLTGLRRTEFIVYIPVASRQKPFWRQASPATCFVSAEKGKPTPVLFVSQPRGRAPDTLAGPGKVPHHRSASDVARIAPAGAHQELDRDGVCAVVL